MANRAANYFPTSKCGLTEPSPDFSETQNDIRHTMLLAHADVLLEQHIPYDVRDAIMKFVERTEQHALYAAR